MTSAEPYGFEEEKLWRPLIGRAILAFGAIEVATVRCLVYLAPRPKLKQLVNLKFGRRVDAVLRLLERDRNGTTDVLAALLRSAKVLARTRNLVAHNPLEMTVYQQGETGEFLLKPEIRRLVGADNEFLDLAGIEKFVLDTESLRRRIDEATYERLFSKKRRGSLRPKSGDSTREGG